MSWDVCGIVTNSYKVVTNFVTNTYSRYTYNQPQKSDSPAASRQAELESTRKLQAALKEALQDLQASQQLHQLLSQEYQQKLKARAPDLQQTKQAWEEAGRDVKLHSQKVTELAQRINRLKSAKLE